MRKIETTKWINQKQEEANQREEDCKQPRKPSWIQKLLFAVRCRRHTLFQRNDSQPSRTLWTILSKDFWQTSLAIRKYLEEWSVHKWLNHTCFWMWKRRSFADRPSEHHKEPWNKPKFTRVVLFIEYRLQVITWLLEDAWLAGCVLSNDKPNWRPRCWILKQGVAILEEILHVGDIWQRKKYWTLIPLLL